MSRAARRRVADQIRALPDILDWPDLKYFNSGPCRRHAPDLVSPVLCRDCGIVLRRHQRVGAAWMYMGPPGLLSDATGSGKTAQVISVLAMCKEHGELGLGNRAVIVCRAPAVHDPWAGELRRLLRGVNVYVADGTPAQRTRGYMSNWEVAVISDRTLSGAGKGKRRREGDVEELLQFPVGILVYDDIDPLRNPETEASYAVNRLAGQCSRVIGLHATPVQKRLTELWGFLQPVGGRDRLGSLERVRSRYVTQTRKEIVAAAPWDKTGRTRVSKVVQVDSGITSDPRLLREFRDAIRPLVLRRRAEDLGGDVTMPAIQYSPVFMDLLPAQRKRYDELRAGTVRRLLKQGEEVGRAAAGAAFTLGSQICSGLAAVDEGPGADVSVKLDWVMNLLTGDLSGEKAVIFVYFKPNVAALAARLKAAGIGGTLMWSAETDKKERARRLDRFRYDPSCRVLVGTTTIEASLNLQAARYLLAVDTILNPARMEQLIGRVARQGSPFPTVYILHALARGTQEDAYLPLLRREAGISAAVWDEEQALFTAGVSPAQQVRMLAYGRIAA
jgi:SNF2 family DNA or RNA helicase